MTSASTVQHLHRGRRSSSSGSCTRPRLDHQLSPPRSLVRGLFTGMNSALCPYSLSLTLLLLPPTRYLPRQITISFSGTWKKVADGGGLLQVSTWRAIYKSSRFKVKIETFGKNQPTNQHWHRHFDFGKQKLLSIYRSQCPVWRRKNCGFMNQTSTFVSIRLTTLSGMMSSPEWHFGETKPKTLISTKIITSNRFDSLVNSCLCNEPNALTGKFSLLCIFFASSPVFKSINLSDGADPPVQTSKLNQIVLKLNYRSNSTTDWPYATCGSAF